MTPPIREGLASNSSGYNTSYSAVDNGLLGLEKIIRTSENNVVVQDVSVTGKVLFQAPGGDDTHAASLRKVIHDSDKSSLRLSLNEKPGDAFEIWGDSCNTGGGEAGCGGEGAVAHKFAADGNAWHKGGVTAGKLLVVADGGVTQLNGPTYTRDIHATGNVNVASGGKAKVCVDGVCITKNDIANFKAVAASIAGMQQKLASTNAAVSDMQQKVSSTNSAVAGMQQKVTATNSAVEGVHQGLSSTTSAVSGIQKKVSSTNDSIAKMDQGWSKTNAAVAGMRQKLSSTNSSIARMDKGLSSTNTTVSGMQQSLSSTKAAVSGMQQKVSTTNAAVAGMQQKFSLMTTSISGVDQRLSSTNTAVSGLQQGLSSLNASVAGIDNKLSSTNVSIVGMEKKLTSMNAGIVEMKLATPATAPVPVPPSLSGSCYGAKEGVCATCGDVINAYNTRGWAYNKNNFEQCK
jgi:peptidoglycan hydrolase CwlO-like protein